MPGWATAANVLNITGSTVTDEWAARASYIVETMTGRSPGDSPGVGTRDARQLGKATCYQAAWMLTQPDLFGRMDITQTGASSSSTTFVDTAMVLAPLAKHALNACSWNQSHTIHVRNGMTRSCADEDDEVDAWGNRWEAM